MYIQEGGGGAQQVPLPTLLGGSVCTHKDGGTGKQLLLPRSPAAGRPPRRKIAANPPSSVPPPSHPTPPLRPEGGGQLWDPRGGLVMPGSRPAAAR